MIGKLMLTGEAIWQVVLMMAPYLLIGFVVAGALSVMLTPEWVACHLGKRGTWQVIKAALLGVPLPLCSCGVIPVAFSLRKSGAGKGATVSFLASTPQTGVDSILLTYSLLGPVIAVVRVASAFVSGILAGILTDVFYGDEPPKVMNPTTAAPTCCCGAEPEPAPVAAHAGAGCCATGQGGHTAKPRGHPAWLRALRYGLVTLPCDMARPLLLGVLASGLVAAWVPEDFFAGRLPPGVIAYVMALTVGIPVYVCSAASVPIAVTFIHMGVSPGAAMVFLIAGPATNLATVASLWRQIGRAGTALYLAAIGAVAVIAGLVLDSGIGNVRKSVPLVRTAHEHAADTTFWPVLAAVALLALLLPGILRHADEPGASGGTS